MTFPYQMLLLRQTAVILVDCQKLCINVKNVQARQTREHPARGERQKLSINFQCLALLSRRESSESLRVRVYFARSRMLLWILDLGDKFPSHIEEISYTTALLTHASPRVDRTDIKSNENSQWRKNIAKQPLLTT